MTEVGTLLRHWRDHRRLSQLELATRCGVSARHISFVETGRSNPTRSMLVTLSEHLDVPLRERNSILLAGGFAPLYPEHQLAEPPLAAISSAIRQILAVSMPNPALVVDRHWNLVDANAAVAMFTDGCAAHLLEPPVNVLRLSLHPDGLAPKIVNRNEWGSHVLARLEHQIIATDDAALRSLRSELRQYVGSAQREMELVVPLIIEGGLSFISTTTVFGTPRDVTVSELAIEVFYPADAQTAEYLRT